jgi:amidohydrolase
VASQIVLGLQTITSRQLDSTLAPAVVSVGAIHGGVRNNIIPDEVEMIGTIRSLEAKMRDDIHARIRRTAESIAAAAGATATVTITTGYPITYNDPALTERIAPTLRRVGGNENVRVVNPVLGAEDFSVFQQNVPGLFFWVGTRPKNQTPEQAPSNHSPLFYVDESGLALGVRALAHVAVEFLEGRGVRGKGDDLAGSLAPRPSPLAPRQRGIICFSRVK